MYSEAPFSNPWAGAIAETIGAPARARANALRAAGQAQAHASEVSGQAYGSALQNIGQTVAAIPQQIQQQKLQQQEAQVRELQIAAAKRQQAGQLVLAQAIKRFSDPQTGKVDHQAIANFVSQNGFPDQGEAWLKMASSNAESLDKLTESTRSHAKQGLETLGDLAFQANSPQEFTAAVGLAATVGLIDEPTAHSIAAQAGNGDAWQATKQKYESYSPKYQAQQAKLREPVKIGEGEKIIIPATGATVAEGAPKQVETQAKSVLLDGKPAEVVFNPKTQKYLKPGTGEDVSARVKPIPSAAQVNINASTLSDAALDQAADKYLQTGQLPSGQGMAPQRAAIMNRAAVKDPTAALARNQAIYKADSANLTKLQTTEGTLSAFEKTAGKNLDQFLSLAEKIPDTGVPWLNTPVRLLTASAVGNANMAAINAARDVALREIARVTNDPKLSGALTDSARAEVLGLSPQNATLPQIKAVAKVLKQDMANVHAGVNEQIDQIKRGLGGNPAAPATQGGTIKVGDFTVKVK